MTFKESFVRSAVIIFAICLFFTQNCLAQRYKKRSVKNNTWEIGISMGGSKFLTAINPNSDAVYKKFNYWNSDLNPAISVSVAKNFSSKFSAEFEWLTTKLSGTWNESTGYPIPPAAIALGLPYPEPFTTGINQFNLMATANLNQLIAPGIASDKWFIFVKIGGGMSLLNDVNALVPLIGNRFKTNFAYGAGFSCNIKENVRLKFGTVWYKVATYHLDGILPLASDNLNSISNLSEKYFSPSLGISFAFGSSKSSQTIKRNNHKNTWVKPSRRKSTHRR